MVWSASHWVAILATRMHNILEFQFLKNIHKSIMNILMVKSFVLSGPMYAYNSS
jgi:hypothetical protein